MSLDDKNRNHVVTLEAGEENQTAIIKLSGDFIDGTIKKNRPTKVINYKDGRGKVTAKKTAKNANDDKIEDTVIFTLQKDPEFKSLSDNRIKIIQKIKEEHANTLYFLKADSKYTKIQKEEMFIYEKLEEYVSNIKNKIILKVPFGDFCKATNIKAYARPNRMVATIDKFKQSTTRIVLKKTIDTRGNKIFIDKESNLFKREESGETIPLFLVLKKVYDKKTKDRKEIKEGILVLDSNNNEFNVEFDKKEDRYFYWDKSGVVVPSYEEITSIPYLKYDFNQEANDLFDDLEITQAKEFKEKFLNARIRNKYTYFTDITIEINTKAVMYLLGLGKDFGYLIKPFRELFESTYTFRLDEIIRRRINQLDRQNIDHFDIDSFEVLQNQMSASDMTTHHFKANVLKPAIEEFNLCTQDMQILSIEKEKVLTKKYGYQQKVRVKLDRKDTRAWKDYIYVKVSEILATSKSSLKINNSVGFKKKVEEIMWNSDNPEFYGKPIATWRKEAEKELSIVDSVKKVVTFLRSLNVNIDYDERKYKICYIEDENKKSFKGISKPSTSLEYILENIKEVGMKYSIEDFTDAVFEYNGNAIVDKNSLSNHKSQITRDINERDISKFSPYMRKTEAFEELIECIKKGLFFDAVAECKKALKKIK